MPAPHGLESSEHEPLSTGPDPDALWIPDDPRAPLNARKPRSAVAAVTAAWGDRPPAQKLAALAFALEDWGTGDPLAPGEKKLMRWTALGDRHLAEAMRGLQAMHERGPRTSPRLLRHVRNARKASAFGQYRLTAPSPDPTTRHLAIITPRPALEVLNYVPRFGMSAGTRLVLSVLAVLARDGIHAEVSLNNLAQLCGVHRNTVYRALLPDKDGTLAPLSMPRRPAGTAPTEDVRPLVGVDTPPNHSPLEPAVWNLAGLYDHAPMDLKESCG